MRTPPLLLVTLVLSACSGTGRVLKEGARAEVAGDWEGAYAAFRAAHLERRGSAKALEGARRAGQQVLQHLEAAASGAFLGGDHHQGESRLRSADEFAARAAVEGVALRRDPQLAQHRAQSREAHGDAVYAEALEAFRQERFDACTRLLDDLLAEQPEHADARHLRRMAKLEPRYRAARRAVSQGRWRAAHAMLGEVLADDPGYKDAGALRDSVQRQAAYTVAHITVEEQGVAARATYLARVNGVPAALATAIKEQVLALGDPFLVLVARDQIEPLLAEQQRAMEGIYDERTAAGAGRLLGARYVLMTKLLQYEEGTGRHLELQANLMDATTGRILRSALVQVAKQDLGRGAVRNELIAQAAKRAAGLLQGFDPETP